MSNLLNIKYLYTDLPELKIPQSGDVGIDLYSNETVSIPYQTALLVHTGVCVQPPRGYWLQVQDRSSVSKYCHTMAGIIDEIYTGEILIRMFCHFNRDGKIISNPTSSPIFAYTLDQRCYNINRGDKIAQLVIRKNYNYEFLLNKVNELKVTERQDKGFGSTGR